MPLALVVQRHRSRTKRLLNVQRDDVRPNEESSVLLMLDRLISKVTRRRVLSKAAVLVSWGVFVSSGERLLRLLGIYYEGIAISSVFDRTFTS